MSIRKGNDIIASKPLIDAVPTQSSTNAVSSGGVYTALQGKQNTISDLATIRSGAAAGATAVQPGDLATVATTGNYNDLSNKPTIPAAQVNSDWNAVSGVAQILNKPTTLSGYGITDGANTDLSNLTSTGANIGNWSHNVSNCITEIPQDIKLELDTSTHTLTLKAGSKVYVPNGVGVFDEVTVASDTIVSTAGGATKYMLFYNRTTGSVWFTELAYQNSGTTPSGDGFYYNTSTNKIVFLRSGVADPYEFSFPIGIVTSDSTKYTNIDQLFNGFGYIGSTVFALPGVKALIPNYRNDDGTLKNTPVTVSSVRTSAIADISRSDIWVFLTDAGMTAWGSSGGNVREYKTRPASAPQTYVRAYVEDENHWIHCLNSTTWEAIDSSDNLVKLFSVNSDANAKITGIFNWDTPFHAVDYNNTEFIGHQAMPTNERFIDLTIGSSGSSYFAPADGYFNFRGYGYSVEIYRNDMHVCVMYPQTEWGAVIMPVSKGQRITILYNLTGDKNLRFYYANGSV